MLETLLSYSNDAEKNQLTSLLFEKGTAIKLLQVETETMD
jgi:hypothetical protein